MDTPSAATSTSNAVFSDLNDDCLLKVFKHLNLADLCSVADVSSRSRQNARSHFASKIKNDFLIVGSCYIDLRARDGMGRENCLFEIGRLVRN